MENENEISTADLYNLIKDLIKKNDEIKSQNNVIKEEIKKEIRDIKEELTGKVRITAEENKQLREENEKLKLRILSNERKLRRFNIIIYGLEEDERNETQAVLNIINNQLNIKCGISDIRDIYRIGRKEGNKKRPLLMEFVNFALKQEILVNGNRLKGTDIFVAKDLTPEDYEKQKYLRIQLKKARENNLQATIKQNTLIVNGVKYTIADLQNGVDFPPELNEGQGEEYIEESEEENGNQDKPGELKVLQKAIAGTSTNINSAPNTYNLKSKKKDLVNNKNPLKRSNRLKN